VGAVSKFGGSVMSAMRHNMNTMMKHDGRGRPGSLRVTVGQSAADADIFYLFLLFLKYKYSFSIKG
jgi:hypothetical protein